MAAVAGNHLAGAELEPVAVGRRNAARVAVEDGHGERHAGGQLEHRRAVGLDRDVADDLAHAEPAGCAEGGAGEVERLAVRDGHGLLDAKEARGTLRRGRPRRVAHRADAARRGVGPVDVVDAADLEDADVLLGELRVVVDAGHGVEDHGRPRHARHHGHDLGEHTAFDRLQHRTLGPVARVPDEDPVQRRRRLQRRVGEPLLRAGHDASLLDGAAQ